MTRYINLQDKTIPCKPLEQFDIKVYREKLNDKYGKSPVANSPLLTLPSSPKKTNKLSNPSFDLLQNKLRDFSSKQSASPTKKRLDKCSPQRASGISQQISKIGPLNLAFPEKSGRVGSTYKSSGPVSEETYLFSKRFETEGQDKQGSAQKPITNMIPLHEIMNMRNKLENAQLNINQISSTYTSEMVRLASVINAQLKKQQK